MFGRFVVGVVVAALAVNVVMVAWVVVGSVAAVAWETVRDKVSPDPFRSIRPRRRFSAGPSPFAGWQQAVTNALLAVALSTYAAAFCANAPVETPLWWFVLGFVALVVAQVANVKSKVESARDPDPDVAAGADAAFPYAVIGAPIAWIVYVAVLLTFTPGMGPLDFIGQALSSAALWAGDWLIVRWVAIGLFLLFAFQAATMVMVAPVALAMMRGEKVAARAPATHPDA